MGSNDPAAQEWSEGEVEALSDLLGHRFSEPALLQRALTHPSAAARGQGHYERLEFLGDRVLGLVMAEWLYKRFAEEKEGELARRFAGLVSRESLAEVAAAVGIDRSLRLAKGEEGAGERDNPALLANACEAVIAALYLDGGLAPARRFIRAQWEALVAADRRPPREAKTALQEWAQARGLALPTYREQARQGPPHAPVFTIAVAVEGHAPESARGRSKRQAEQAAARALLARLTAGQP